MNNATYNWRGIWLDVRHLLYDKTIARQPISTSGLAAMLYGLNRVVGSTDNLPSLRLLIKYMTIRAREGRLPDDIIAEQPDDEDYQPYGTHYHWRLNG